MPLVPSEPRRSKLPKFHVITPRQQKAEADRVAMFEQWLEEAKDG